MMRFSGHTLRSLPVLAGVLIGLGGCGKSAQPTSSGPSWQEIAPHMQPAGQKHLAGVVAQILPLGQVPYDNFSLPVVSADGRYLATQTGAPPDWDMALARDGARPPAATQIEIYEIVPGESQPVFRQTLVEPALLGRSIDNTGFLIESIRDDGSRWIGHVNWTTGAIQWLVKDEHVNAFACLGPEGRLAWSRRAVGEADWRLAVRHGMDVFEVGTPGESWVMPTWTGRGDSMFVMTLTGVNVSETGGELSANYVIARSDAAVRQSRRRDHVASDSSAYSAYQSLNGQVNNATAAPPRTDRLFFQHPVVQRTVMWSPLEIGDESAMRLNRHSTFALPLGNEFALVTTNEHLVQQELSLSSPPAKELLAGLHIPRRTGRTDMPYLLLSPQTGYVSLTGMNLLDREQLARQETQ